MPDRLIEPVDVLEWANIERSPTSKEHPLLDRICTLVSGEVTAACMPLADNDQDPDVQQAAMEQAAAMWAARLWKRRHTPEGLMVSADMTTAVRIGGWDRDEERVISRWDIRW